MWDWDWPNADPFWFDPDDTLGSWLTVHVIAAPASAEDHGRPKGKPRPA